MAKKHFEEYLAQIYAQYSKLQEGLVEFQKYAEDHIVDEDRIESFKATIKPVADTYNTMLYIKYLLDMPQRDKKKSIYEKQNKKHLNKIDKSKLGENVIKANQQIISSLGVENDNK